MEAGRARSVRDIRRIYRCVIRYSTHLRLPSSKKQSITPLTVTWLPCLPPDSGGEVPVHLLNPRFMMRYFFVFLFLCMSLRFYAQCDPQPPVADGMVIVNEVGNFGHNGEYVELVVVGNPANPRAPVNMTDWILDDNNFARVDHGNEPGHLRFGTCFSAVPPGTIIVIYNTAEPGPVAAGADGTPNAAGNYQAGSQSACMYGCEGTPNHSSAGYTKINIVAGEWIRLVPLRNWGDGIQVRNVGGGFKHGIFWGSCIPGGGGIKVPLPGQSIAGLSVQYIGAGGGWNEVANYTVTSGATPGLPNGAANAAWIASLK